ncbi:CGNR zinc finger domain-containing protein [Streptomyces monticola]|uniref:CGNR zinc finger domain-containing protein n=1 Tax=Streptomyces monticola TaxID=2666263 RepID=A0ABW2JUN6_9ACTN
MRRQAELLAALVNLAVPGLRQGAPYEAPTAAEVLSGFATHFTEPRRTALTDTEGAGEGLVELAADLHGALTAPGIAATATRLNTLIDRCHAHPYLTNDTGQPFHLHFHGTGGPVQAVGGELATALALVIDTLGEDRFGTCEAHACDRVYVDLTRNGARRYCGTACAARAKTAAYRARRGTR